MSIFLAPETDVAGWASIRQDLYSFESPHCFERAEPALNAISEDMELPFLGSIRWTSDGLVPAIVQDVETGDVLMLAWMDEPAVRRTFATGQTHFYSRSRKSAWHKGATSGHIQEVASIALDCDADVLLIQARQVGGACHEGYRSCFFRKVTPDGRLERTATPVFEAGVVYEAIHATESGAS